MGRKVLAPPFSLALKEPVLPLVPGGQARKAPGPVLPADPCQRGQHDDADGHPLIEAAAVQHVPEHGQPYQSPRRLGARA